MTPRHATVTLGALCRAVPRRPLLLAAGAAPVAVAGVVGLGGGHRGAILALQASTVALAGAAVTLLDEPRGLLDALPTTRARRRALVLGAGLPALAALWVLLLVVGGADRDEAAALTVQLAAVTCVALGLGARDGDPARAIAGVALAFGAGRVLFGAQLFPAGTEAAHWMGARGWWTAAACAGLLLLAIASRDAATPRHRR
jgi:hypothetical protein